MLCLFHMTLNQRRWLYVSAISFMIALGSFIPGERNEKIRASAGLSASVVGLFALVKVR